MYRIFLLIQVGICLTDFIPFLLSPRDLPYAERYHALKQSFVLPAAPYDYTQHHMHKQTHDEICFIIIIFYNINLLQAYFLLFPLCIVLVMCMKGFKGYIVFGILFVSVLGTLFHFVYEWSGDSILVGLFAPVNESIWEHTKLIFFPMLLYSFYLNKKLSLAYPCITSAMAAGSLLGVLLIIVFFYTYSGVIGFHTPTIDKSIFYISVIIAFYAVYKWTLSCRANGVHILLQFLQILLIIAYVFFTFFPLDYPLFINPQFK